MRIGAIDIGTNAVRLVVKEVNHFRKTYHSHKVCYTRVPIRLGEDVFTGGRIEKKKVKALQQTMLAFKQLMEATEVVEFRAMSTSAMREAENGKEVLRQLKKSTGVDIELISGEEEAEMIMSNFATMDLDRDQHYLYIDVGGGSTEISLILNGDILRSQSFRIGTVRLLRNKVKKSEWKALRAFCDEIDNNYAGVIGIGTGGNINRLFKMAGRTQGESIYVEDIERQREHISSYTYKERLFLLKLKPDRADVIIPAADIFIEVMNTAGVIEMLVPKIGLSDGVILKMFDQMRG